MKEILDSEITSSPGNFRSRRACWFFVANLFIVLLIFGMTAFITQQTLPNPKAIDKLYIIAMGGILSFISLGLIGFRYAVLSIIKKEKWTYVKIVGAVGNFLFFVIIILLFVANTVDILKWWNGT